MEFDPTALKELRRREGLNQTHFGKLAGVDQRMLSRYELGIHAPSAQNLTKIARAFRVPMDYFFTD